MGPAIALLLTVMSSEPVSREASAQAAARSDLRAKWWNLAKYPDDGAIQSGLAAAGEPALEALVDLLCGEELGAPPNEAAVAELVRQLGERKFADRERAQRELHAFGPVVLPLLKPHLKNPDAEIRRRIAVLVESLTQPPPSEDLVSSLESAATSMLEQSWSLTQIQNVARRNIRRLATVEIVNYGWGNRPLAPLLAGLRMSERVEDRNLLANILTSAKDGAAETILAVMRDGISTRTARIAEHWKRPPPHDYRAAALAMLDPARPKVFVQALYTAKGHPQYVSRLHQLLDRKLPFAQFDVVTFVLWCSYGDAKARDLLFRELDNPSDERFESALGTLTDRQQQYQGPAVIPKLRPILRSSNAKRRLLALERLDTYLGKESVELATDEAGRFLGSSVDVERQTAERVLKNLQETGWINVFRRLATKGETEYVRQTAAALEKRYPSRAKE